MNVSSALLKQIIELQDFETWNDLRQHYLPDEYHSVFKILESHADTYHQLPTFQDLTLSVRDGAAREQICAIEAVEVDIEPALLLEYLKNEYTQKEVLNSIESYLEDSVCFESAEESIEHLHQIILDVEEKVDLDVSQETMQRITLLESDEELARYLALGINHEHDHEIQFSPRDYILVGGPRGSGKSLTCNNVANNVYESGKSALYFTIEMDSRSIIQRNCAIGAEVPYSRLRRGNLSYQEWERVAAWWAGRFLNGEQYLHEYLDHRDFNKMHEDLSTKTRIDPVRQLDVIYDPGLTLSKIRSEVDRRVKSEMDIGIIIVDYINQVRRSTLPSRGGIYDWTEQIEVSKALKSMAQEYEIPVFSPYQIDASGEARFAKGILDAADAAYTLNGHKQDDQAITFTCVKARASSLLDFTSTMNWETLKMGPESAQNPDDKSDDSEKTGEDINDLD